MANHFPLLCIGKAKKAFDLEVVAPFDGAIIGQISCADESLVEQALAAAAAVFADRKQWIPLPKRIEILEETIVLMRAQQDELAVEAAREGGKPLKDSQVEVARAIDGVQICIETLRTEAGHVIPMNYNAGSSGRMAVTQKEPIGVVVAISAFNHPLNLIVHQVAAAVAVGCPVIIKPASDTPLSCWRFVKLLHQAGLPVDWCQALILSDNALANKLCTDPRVGFFSFIGSARVGWQLKSQLAPGTRCALEHGGVAPVIVEKDADLNKAIPLLSKGGFYHAGQVCVSVQRVFVEQSIAEQVAQQLAKSAQQLKIGDPTLAGTDVGPLIRHSEVDRVAAWVNEAVSDGAELLSGGNKISDSCYECSVLYNPPLESKVMQQEIFGPVVCIYPYQKVEQAIQMANALPFSFQASVFTENVEQAMYIYKNINASAVMLNDHTAFRVDGMPFAGLKQSGYGVGGIPHTMHDMQTEKMLVIKSDHLR